MLPLHQGDFEGVVHGGDETLLLGDFHMPR
jgi:hypothetical protein